MPFERFASGLLAALLLLLLLSAGSALAEEAPEDDPKVQAKALAAQMRAEEPDLRLEAAKAAVRNGDSSLTSPLIKLLGDDVADVRLAAFEALSTRATESDARKAASAITTRLPRLEKDAADRDEALAAIAALQTLAQPGPVKDLIKSIKNDSDPELVRAKLLAIGHVPDVEAVDRLIQFLAKGRRGGLKEQRKAAVDALRIATGQRFGDDPDVWRAWWKDARDGFDFAAIADARADQATKAEERRARRDARREKRGDGKRGKKGDADGDTGDA